MPASFLLPLPMERQGGHMVGGRTEQCREAASSSLAASGSLPTLDGSMRRLAWRSVRATCVTRNGSELPTGSTSDKNDLLHSYTSFPFTLRHHGHRICR